MSSWRDEAIVRLTTETGLRAGEVIGMGIADVDLKTGARLHRLRLSVSVELTGGTGDPSTMG